MLAINHSRALMILTITTGRDAVYLVGKAPAYMIGPGSACPSAILPLD